MSSVCLADVQYFWILLCIIFITIMVTATLEVLSQTDIYNSWMSLFGCWWKWETTQKLKSINNKYFMWVTINKMTMGNIVFVIPVGINNIIPEPGITFEANAKVPTGILRDYGLRVFFAIFPLS